MPGSGNTTSNTTRGRQGGDVKSNTPAYVQQRAANQLRRANILSVTIKGAEGYLVAKGFVGLRDT